METDTLMMFQIVNKNPKINFKKQLADEHGSLKRVAY